MKTLQKVKTFAAVLLLSTALPVFADNAVNDSLITGKIKSSLAADSITHASTIHVTTNNGRVTLSGTAQSETEATKAVEIAESTMDVKSVDASNLDVTGGTQPMTDAYITAKVKGMFVKNNLTSGEQNVPLASVKVETKDGVVYLSGTVKKVGETDKLIQLAKSVDGVTEVKSSLEIAS